MFKKGKSKPIPKQRGFSYGKYEPAVIRRKSETSVLNTSFKIAQTICLSGKRLSCWQVKLNCKKVSYTTFRLTIAPTFLIASMESKILTFCVEI